jgi:hypothetical protein
MPDGQLLFGVPAVDVVTSLRGKQKVSKKLRGTPKLTLSHYDYVRGVCDGVQTVGCPPNHLEWF